MSPSLPAENRPLPQRFYSLDALRGLASLSVVLFHWQNFFFEGTTFMPDRQTCEPLYFALWPIYSQGKLAVEIFFTLSGFIFFWLYAQPIADRKIRPREFFVLRFSRLYPLHFATLVFVMAAQWFVRARFGSFFVYTENDPFHFILHLFFASNWGLEDAGLCFGLSLNAPVWSVSVEILLYVIFFLFCTARLHRWWHLLLAAIVGGCLCTTSHPFIGRGILSFFIGGLCFKLFSYVHERRKTSTFALASVGVLATWGMISFAIKHYDLYAIYHGLLGTRCVVFGHDIIGAAFLSLPSFPFHLPIVLILFPMTIVSLALLESSLGGMGKHLAFLGDISYSSYLLHFPLQLVFAALALQLGLDWTFFRSPAVLLLFFATLLPLSWLTYHYFEKPAQLYLRRRLGAAKVHRVDPTKAPHSSEN